MNRNSHIDFIKGMAIICMVIGHAGANIWINKFIYLWHMAVFFMASGYFFNAGKLTDCRKLGQYAFKRFYKLQGTYVFWSVVFMLCHNLFIELNIYTDNPEFETAVPGIYNHVTPYWHTIRKFCGSIFWAFFMMSSPNGAFWFLKALLVSSLLYGVITFVLNKVTKFELYAQTLIALLLLGIGKIIPYCLFLHYIGGHVVFTAYALMHLGQLMRIAMENFPSKWSCCSAGIGFLILILLLQLDRFELAMNQYHSIPVLLLASISGWLFLYGLSSIPFYGMKIVEFIGERTMPILIFHFFSFKIVSAAGVFALGLPHYCIAAFPVYFHGFLWCLAYTMVGIGVPILLYEIYAYVQKNLPKKISYGR